MNNKTDRILLITGLSILVFIGLLFVLKSPIEQIILNKYSSTSINRNCAMFCKCNGYRVGFSGCIGTAEYENDY